MVASSSSSSVVDPTAVMKAFHSSLLSLSCHQRQPTSYWLYILKNQSIGKQHEVTSLEPNTNRGHWCAIFTWLRFLQPSRCRRMMNANDVLFWCCSLGPVTVHDVISLYSITEGWQLSCPLQWTSPSTHPHICHLVFSIPLWQNKIFHVTSISLHRHKASAPNKCTIWPWI